MNSFVAQHHPPSPWPASRWLWLLTALTLLVLLVHGYHPLAEDGGLYVAGILWKLDPTLFPQYTAFVTEHLRFSVFAPFVAGLVRYSHVPLQWALFLLYLLSIALTLFAARQILRRIIVSESAQLAGVALLAAWWTLPVAATSLMLMDPYLTARNFSLPLSLLAVAFALDDWRRRPHSPLACAACLLLAFLFHPLMAGYAITFIILLRVVQRRRAFPLLALLTASALAVAFLIQIHAPPEPSALRSAEITRYYWFLSQWHWYELLGIVAPLAIFAGGGDVVGVNGEEGIAWGVIADPEKSLRPGVGVVGNSPWKLEMFGRGEGCSLCCEHNCGEGQKHSDGEGTKGCA